MQVFRVLILLFLIIGFWILFNQLAVPAQLAEVLKRTRMDMDAASRQRSLAQRQSLLALQKKHSLWYAVEQMLQYSGIKRRFPGMSVEKWVFLHIACGSLLFLMTTVLLNLLAAVVVLISLLGLEWTVIRFLRRRNYRKTEENLTKLLDFLGNYSLSAGEITSVLGQVGRYMDEPIKWALDSCYYEATTTGDAGMALLSMAERLEHPKFKEMARNMEISLRYCADFSLLVESSRRSLREYMRYSKERQGMPREAGISLGLLIGMSAVALVMVEKLIGGSYAMMP